MQAFCRICIYQGLISCYNLCMQTKSTEQYFLFGLLFLMLVFTFFIFKPFWVVLVLGASFALVLSPIHRWLKKHKLPSWLSALLTVLLFLIVICGPLLGIGVLVFDQSQSLYRVVASGQNIYPFVDHINSSINKLLPSGFSFNIYQKISDFLYLLSDNVAQIFSTTLTTVFSFVLILLTIFYFLKDGEKWKQYIISLSPISDINDNKIIHRLKETVNSVVFGYLFVALCQGVLMGIGLYVFGVPHPALWAMVSAIASLIPTVGTSLVSIPVIIFLYSTGHVVSAIGFLCFAVLLVGLIDNFLSPLIVSKKVKIPEFMILFSVLGGVAMFGPIGVLIGPITISMLHALISIYKDEPTENKTI